MRRRIILTGLGAVALALTIGVMLSAPAIAAPKPCPPGLAKKDPACVPPGLAKKPGYGVGDRIRDDYRILRNPDRYGLDRRGTYYRVGDYLYRVDPETKQVLDLIGAVVNVLN